MTGTGRVPQLSVTGPARHGVVAYSRALADAVAVVADRIATTSLEPDPDHAALHLHFTDRLFGSSPAAAAEAIEAVAATRTITVTLHDLPQLSDGPDNLARRAAAYRRVVAAAAGVAVNSRHEASLMREFLGEDMPVPEVIPLGWAYDPEQFARIPPHRGPLESAVGIVGFIYPGKGHTEVIDALAELPTPRPALVALGEASVGHLTDVAHLKERARDHHVRLEVTGYLDESELLGRCARVAVPMAAHQHVSASASVLTWLAAGRRPLVPDSRYSRELAALRPGTVTLYDPVNLWRAIQAALAEPASTMLPADAVLAPSMEDAARAYLDWWENVLAC